MQQSTIDTRPIQVVSASKWLDWLIVLIVIVISAASLLYTYSTGAFSITLSADTNWSWYLVRSTGMIAYTLMAASMIWGLVLSSHILKNWTPGPLSMLFHATTSWAAVVLSVAHALLLLFDKYYTYKLVDILLPFSAPYRPLATGLGIVSFWLTLAITISFSLRKLIGRRAWVWLHMTSYGAFALITAHVLLAGSDASQMGVRMIIFGAVLSIFVLFGWRIIRSQLERDRSQRKAAPR